MGVISIDFSAYLKKIYSSCPDFKSQGYFASVLFNSAGNKSFSVSKYSSHDYPKKILNGSKPLTDNIRTGFPSPIDAVGLHDFLTQNIDSTKVRTLMLEFGIPQSVEENVSLLSTSLVAQFQLFMTNTDDNVADIVSSEYQRLLANPVAESKVPATPLYPGDKIWILKYMPRKSYTLGIYENFHHVWLVRNIGNQTWVNRRLFFSNYMDVKPKASSNYINVPTVAPGAEIEIAVAFETRGVEGTFECIWEMQGVDGLNCFPNEQRLFTVTINVNFESNNNTEV